MEGGKFAYVVKPFDFHNSVRSIVLAISVAAQAQDLNLSVDLDPAIDRLVSERGQLSGDELRFRQVLSNLASNACKFTEPGGQVRIATKLLSPILAEPSETFLDPSDASSKGVDLPQDDGARPDRAIIRIEVFDTGVGISGRDLKDSRLFSPYVQTEIGRRQGGKGSGLGLALVRHIVKLSKGRLGVKSRKGEGSEFWFELSFHLPPRRSSSSTVVGQLKRPAAVYHISSVRTLFDTPQVVTVNPISPTEQSAMVSSVVSDILNNNRMQSDGSSEDRVSATDEKVPPSPPEAPLSIFVVDDDMLTRLLMTRMLTRLGHCVTCAENGQVALQRIEERAQGKVEEPQFDLVFLDNQMPFMNGVEVVAHLREQGLPIYVCGVTGNALKEDQEEYLDAGADRVLTKPVLEADLKSTIAISRLASRQLMSTTSSGSKNDNTAAQRRGSHHTLGRGFSMGAM